MTLSNVPGRVLLTPFQNSFTGWKGRFFKICCSDLVPSALDGFPQYWVRETRALKSKPFKKLAPNDQVVCRILAEAGGFVMEEGQAQPHKKDKSQDISIQSQTKSV